MNKVYNVICSEAQRSWVVVAEGAKRTCKSSAKAIQLLIAVIVTSAPLPVSAASLPQGGLVSSGDGSIVSNGNQLTIKQAIDKLGINWQSFNIADDGRVVFEQPNSKSVALNRVIGSDGSAIMGKLDANGQVFIINPNGIIFGKNSKINVGGLVALTLDVDDDDFQAGNLKFTTGGKAGEVVSNGAVQASEGGYNALIGKRVNNLVAIQAKLGAASLASLAAGDAVTLDFSGDGLINLKVDKAAVGALVNSHGLKAGLMLA